MGTIIYTLNVSIDGYVEGPNHDLSWTTVDEEVHTWFNDHERALQGLLYGRRLYELMAGYWPQLAEDATAPAYIRDYAQIWASTPKVVFSSTLSSVEHNSRLVRGDVGEVLASVRREWDGDLGVAGPTLAAQFVERGLVDEFRLMVHPIAIGAGTPYWPTLGRPVGLRLVETRQFASGVVLLAYARP